MTPKDDPTGTRLTALREHLVAEKSIVREWLKTLPVNPDKAAIFECFTLTINELANLYALNRLTAPSVSPTEPAYSKALRTSFMAAREPEAPTPEIDAIERWWYSQVTDDFDESPQATKQRLTAALAKMETLLHALRFIEARTPVVDKG